MSLCEGQIKIGKKKVKKRTIRFLFQRYLKKNYRYKLSEFNNKYKYEILDPIKINNLEFFIDLNFNGVNPKEIELRSIDYTNNEDFKLYEEWIKRNLEVDIGELNLQKRSFRWGTIKVKLTKLNKNDPGCITIKFKYK
ncbi:hypothetical protein QTH51_10275 [Clostridium perfringens]|uniref:hypothetical protein n=1 Tax=Clostridium perfringens TaxID=1502 RepID=UPI001F06F6A2|nr:hypothetical protein [Clostridium perfringens]MCH1961808.1 hypothetical protein [Clostridium perfringens]MDM0460743.1 hypothetical protein [Clostridium perfringens]